jgi:hypothetical protein
MMRVPVVITVLVTMGDVPMLLVIMMRRRNKFLFVQVTSDKKN